MFIEHSQIQIDYNENICVAGNIKILIFRTRSEIHITQPKIIGNWNFNTIYLLTAVNAEQDKRNPPVAVKLTVPLYKYKSVFTFYFPCTFLFVSTILLLHVGK